MATARLRDFCSFLLQINIAPVTKAEYRAQAAMLRLRPAKGLGKESVMPSINVQSSEAWRVRHAIGRLYLFYLLNTQLVQDIIKTCIHTEMRKKT